MNNSHFVIENASLNPEEPINTDPHFREREGELTAILEALQVIAGSNEWSTLKKSVFDGKTNALNRELLAEAKKEIPDALKLNRLAGELKWAERFSDLSKLETSFRLELTQVRKQLYGKEER